MRKPEFDGVLSEDLERFKELLVSFYGSSWEDSYLQFTSEISERLRRKDTNPKYKSYFESNLNDLVMAVVSRFIRINSKLQRAGQQIHSFPAMLENRIGHVYHEELRRLAKILPLPDTDDSDATQATYSLDKELEQNEKRALKIECYRKCFDKLPARISKIFVEYYDTPNLSPTERTHARQQLALKLAKASSVGGNTQKVEKSQEQPGQPDQ